jgi:hypothetical protein
LRVIMGVHACPSTAASPIDVAAAASVVGGGF